jgi:protein O-GlcNAc transferase
LGPSIFSPFPWSIFKNAVEQVLSQRGSSGSPSIGSSPESSQSPANPHQLQELTQAVNASPSAFSPHMELGRMLANSGEFTAALKQFDIALTLRPDDAEAVYNRGLTCLLMAETDQERDAMPYYQRLSEAEKSFRQALQLDPKLPGIHSNFGRLYHLIGDQDAAIREFRAETEIHPASVEAWNNLGSALGAAKNFNEAISSYERALSLDLKCTSCLLNLQSAIQQQGSEKSALAKYKELTAAKPGAPLSHLLYGMILSTTYDHEDAAVAELNLALRADPNLAAAHFFLGNFHRHREDNAGGAAEYRLAAKLAPGKIEFVEPLAIVLLKEHKDQEGAAALQQAMALDPNKPSLHYWHSVVLQRAGHVEEANQERRETDRLEKEDQTQSQLELNLRHGITDLMTGRSSDAVYDLRAALALGPNHPETSFYLGIALSQTGDAAGAFQSFEKALAWRPESAEFHYNYGIALWKAGQSSSAIEQFRRTLQIQPDDAVAHCALGMALLRSGSTEDGNTEIVRAQQLGSCSPSAR